LTKKAKSTSLTRHEYGTLRSPEQCFVLIPVAMDTAELIYEARAKAK